MPPQCQPKPDWAQITRNQRVPLWNILHPSHDLQSCLILLPSSFQPHSSSLRVCFWGFFLGKRHEHEPSPAGRREFPGGCRRDRCVPAVPDSVPAGFPRTSLCSALSSCPKNPFEMFLGALNRALEGRAQRQPLPVPAGFSCAPERAKGKYLLPVRSNVE